MHRYSLAIEEQRAAFSQSLSEKDRRRYAAIEACTLGRGGLSYMARVLRGDRHTIAHSQYLWGNASYAMAMCLTNAFATYGWCAAITGIDEGGLVEGLPIHAGRTEEGEAALRGPVEIFLTDRREEELAKLGFLPLVHCKGTEYAAFFSAPSVQKARRSGDEAVAVTARFSTQLPYTFVISRFAHYLRAITHETLGRLSRVDCEQFLNRWLKTYVTQDDNASPAMPARYPLRDAWIEVVEEGEQPGRYTAFVFLRPHFQLEVPPLPLTVVVQI